jgi:hypothetical protein
MRARTTGNQGSRISPHRSIATVGLSRGGIALSALLTVVVTLAFLLAVGVITRVWTAAFRWMAEPLGLGAVGERVTVVAPVLRVSVPYFTIQASTPSWPVWWFVLIVTVLVLLASVLIARRHLPLAYALRFLAVIQCSALLFFGLARDRFPYDLPDYVSGMMLVGLAVVGVVPLLLGLTYYIIDVRWWQKIALSAAMMGHLLVFIPLQYATQSYFIARGTLLVMPLLFIMFGMLPEIMIIVAFYGWGMSWRPNVARGHRQ